MRDSYKRPNIRAANNRRRTPPPPRTVTIRGQNEIYNQGNLVGPFWNTLLWYTPRPPSPFLIGGGKGLIYLYTTVYR